VYPPIESRDMDTPFSPPKSNWRGNKIEDRTTVCKRTGRNSNGEKKLYWNTHLESIFFITIIFFQILIATIRNSVAMSSFKYEDTSDPSVGEKFKFSPPNENHYYFRIVPTSNASARIEFYEDELFHYPTQIPHGFTLREVDGSKVPIVGGAFNIGWTDSYDLEYQESAILRIANSRQQTILPQFGLECLN
jgi:hypothetical protein